jgi:hypothetical protein
MTHLSPYWGDCKIMKSKHLIILLTAALLFSFIGVVWAADKCPECRGTGKVTQREPCPTCQGASAVKPDVVKKGSLQAGASPSDPQNEIIITAVFQNNEVFEVQGTVTAQVKTTTDVFSNSSKATFPPQSEVTISLAVKGAKREPYWAYSMELSDVNTGDCPDCNGLGYISTGTITCPECGGTGVASAFGTGLFNLGGVGGAIVGVVVVGAVAVTSFMVIKKRRVSEESLRRLSSFEFQDWVANRLSANRSSQKDSFSGIDALSMEGYPIQIRQEDDVGKRAIDSFAAALARSKARSGTIVAFGFGKDAYEGVMKARINYRLEVKTVTVRELLLSKN